MARQHLRNVIQAVSIENTDLAEYLTGDDGAKFRKFPAEASNPVFPTRQTVEDNMVGDGRAYPKQSKPYRFDPRNIPYAGALNSTMGVRLLRLFLGGAIVETTNVVPGTIDSAIKQKAPGAVPLLCNILRSNGGEDFVHGDVFVQSLEMSQTGDGEPRISATLSNSGHFIKIADTTIDTADIDDMDAYYKYHGVKTTLTFDDGVTSYDFANEGRLIDVNFQGNQNVIVDNLPGDPFYDANNECHGAYSANIFIDVQTGMMRAKVYMDENFTNFDAWLPNRKLTDVKLTFKTCEIIGLTTHHAEIEIHFPIAEFNLEPDQQNNFSAYSFNIKAIEGDPVTGCLILARVRQETSVDETIP